MFALVDGMGVAEEEATDVSTAERAGTLEKKVRLRSNMSVVFGAELGGRAVEAAEEENGKLEVTVTAGGDGFGISVSGTGAFATVSVGAEACS